MERSLFGFILRYSRRDQLRIVPFVLATMVVYYASLDLPKTIINEAIQGGRFTDGATETTWLGVEFGRLEYLFLLSGLPRPDRPERLAQVPHQHDERLDGRAHAAGCVTCSTTTSCAFRSRASAA